MIPICFGMPLLTIIHCYWWDGIYPVDMCIFFFSFYGPRVAPDALDIRGVAVVLFFSGQERFIHHALPFLCFLAIGGNPGCFQIAVILMNRWSLLLACKVWVKDFWIQEARGENFPSPTQTCDFTWGFEQVASSPSS